ncbi:MAG: hypothetical protein HC892_11140 [Saprospiraceae bacterium]|nr:hypothetical protein [Saprospiraceae bacterium]
MLVNVSVAAAYSQQKQPQQIIKIDPLALFAATFSMDYERVLSHQMSAQVGAAYTMQQVEFWDGLGGRLRGYHIEGAGASLLHSGYRNCQSNCARRCLRGNMG